MRSTSRMVGVSINTVTKLLVEPGRACAEYEHSALRNLPFKKFQLDKISTSHVERHNLTIRMQNHRMTPA